MGPLESPDNHEHFEGESADLGSRFSISIETFRCVAKEVAENLGEPIAICRRDENQSGSASVPFQNKPLQEAQEDGSNIVEIVYPPKKDLHLAVTDALSEIPEGEALDRYFGISSGNPEQTAKEAKDSARLIDKLRTDTLGEGNLDNLMKEISDHAASSPLDPEALRALMRRPKKTSDEL